VLRARLRHPFTLKKGDAHEITLHRSQ
jgi:hypothetical protein